MANRIILDLDTSKSQYNIYECKQNDDLLLEANIFENGIVKDITNATVTINCTRSDGTFVIQNTEITKENNKIIANLKRDFTRVGGLDKLEIVLTENGKQNTTFDFNILVKNSVISGAVESTNTATILEELGNKIVQAGEVKAETEALIQNGGAATTGDIANVNTQLAEIAQKGTTVEVLEKVTKEEINRQVSDGTIANLTIAKDSISNDKYKEKSITQNKLSKSLSDCFIDKFNEVSPTWKYGACWVVAIGGSYKDGSMVLNSKYNCFELSVTEADRFKITTSVGNQVACYAILDTNDNVLDIYPKNAIGTENTEIINELYILVPTNGTKLRVTTFKSTYTDIVFSCSKFNGSNVNTKNLEYMVNQGVSQDGLLINKQFVDEYNNKGIMPINYNFNKYPLLPYWGGEYLSHWYEKVYEGLENATVVLDGDSITEGSIPLYEGVNDSFKNMRGRWLKKIMKSGGYPLEKLTVVNNGHGGKTTNEWVGRSDLTTEPLFKEEGYLNEGMKRNPDLLIIAYGMNDANKGYPNKTLKDRLALYEENLREGLTRIRYQYPINGRPNYNKRIKDLSIIICNCTVAEIPSTGRSYEIWNQYIREINQRLAREYHCAFADLTMATYDYKGDGTNWWATLNANGTKGNIHPNKYNDAYIFSQLKDLIYPVGLHNINVD